MVHKQEICPRFWFISMSEGFGIGINHGIAPLSMSKKCPCNKEPALIIFVPTTEYQFASMPKNGF